MCSLGRVFSELSRAAPGSLRCSNTVFGLQAPDLRQAPLHAPSPLCPPLVHHVEEPVAHDGVDVDFAAVRTAAAGLVFDECSGWRGRSGRSADAGDLLVSERSSDGVPGCHQPGRC